MTGTERIAEHGVLYLRELPGGGYVAIERDDEINRGHARVWVERRGVTDRRSGHAPPIIAEIEGDEHSAEFAELHRMVSDNAAIARALMQWQREHPQRGD